MKLIVFLPSLFLSLKIPSRFGIPFLLFSFFHTITFLDYLAFLVSMICKHLMLLMIIPNVVFCS